MFRLALGTPTAARLRFWVCLARESSDRLRVGPRSRACLVRGGHVAARGEWEASPSSFYSRRRMPCGQEERFVDRHPAQIAVGGQQWAFVDTKGLSRRRRRGFKRPFYPRKRRKRVEPGGRARRFVMSRLLGGRRWPYSMRRERLGCPQMGCRDQARRHERYFQCSGVTLRPVTWHPSSQRPRTPRGTGLWPAWRARRRAPRSGSATVRTRYR